MAAGSVGRGHSRLRQSTGRPAQQHRSMRQSNGSRSIGAYMRQAAPRPKPSQSAGRPMNSSTEACRTAHASHARSTSDQHGKSMSQGRLVPH
jgi:hypothetical protein